MSERHERELETVRRVSQTLFESIDLERVLHNALATALREVDAESGSILLADHEAQTLVFEYSMGESPVPRGTSIPWDQGISGAVFRSGEARITADARESGQHYGGVDDATGSRTRDMITLPLRRWGGEPIGVLNVINKRRGQLDERDATVLTIIAAFAALAIQQARTFQEARLADVARLLGNVGHDLKNLLTPVISCSQLLAGELEDVFAQVPQTSASRASRELCIESIDVILKSSDRIRDRVREIADCVKGRSSPPHFAPCQIALLVQEMFRTLEVIARERGATLQTDGLDQLPELYADESRLYTALYNLVINALPEVSEGGRIRIGGRAEGERVCIEVQDDGRGMPEEVRQTLFTARAFSGRRGGTGLGTRIVKDVIDAHHGEINVVSAPGQGTTFTIWLPVDPR